MVRSRLHFIVSSSSATGFAKTRPAIAAGFNGALDRSCSRLVPYFTVLAECSYYRSKKYYDSIYLLTAA